jgi:hypothetical protein
VVLLGKREVKMAERGEMQARIAQVESSLDEKRAEGEALTAKRAAVVAAFEALVADMEQFKEPLSKIFFR